MTLNCLRCGGEYERRRGRPSHFCASCRIERHREQDRERLSRRRALARDIRLDVDTYRASWLGEDDETGDAVRLEWLMGCDAGAAFATVEEFAQAVDEGDPWALVPDRRGNESLPGSTMPAGPDDGTSTGWSDLAEWLDRRAREVAAHPWHAANPHWAFALDGDDPDLEHLEAA
ncbi:MAG TPA: hypothetical protein VFL65_00770 [Jatrophihabitans sp.]|nr:hypothetical protein [Jatrophihabitans sp.]